MVPRFALCLTLTLAFQLSASVAGSQQVPPQEGDQTRSLSEYREDLKEYERLVQEQEQKRRAATPLIVVFLLLCVAVVYNTIAARQRFHALIQQNRENLNRVLEETRKATEQAAVQNARIIELLESIDGTLKDRGP